MFRVVERTGIDHLVRERQIIRSARQDFAKKEGQDKYQELNPLLFADYNRGRIVMIPICLQVVKVTQERFEDWNKSTVS